MPIHANGVGFSESDEVLTLSEASAYLKLAERTMHRMIKAREIPCARVGGQWRFLRSVLDDWLISRMQVLPRNEFAPLLEAQRGSVQLSPLLIPDAVVDPVAGESMEQVIRELVQPLINMGMLPAPDRFVSAVLTRERLSSTALGHHVAVPHVRRPAENPEGAIPLIFGRHRGGVDLDAPDGEPVHFFFLPVTTSEAFHLRLLKRITMLFRDRSVGQALMEVATAAELVDELTKQEQRLFPGD